MFCNCAKRDVARETSAAREAGSAGESCYTCSNTYFGLRASAWFAQYKQEHDQQFSDQNQVIQQQGEEIQRLNRTVQAYEDIEIRKLKESGRSKVLAALQMQHMPPHCNMFVDLSCRQKSMLEANKISHQALLATSYDQYQKQGNQKAHDPVAEVVANALLALPQADRMRFVELFHVVFGNGVYQSIVQGWTLQT